MHRVPGGPSILVLLVGVTSLVQQAAVPLAQIPPVTERFGRITPLISLPVWLSIDLAVATAIASTERGLRMRYRWLFDAADD